MGELYQEKSSRCIDGMSLLFEWVSQCIVSSMIKIKTTLFCLSFLSFGFIASCRADNQIQLYAMDCGNLHVSDMSSLSDEGLFDGQEATLAVPCFLIRHPKGDLIWDTGLEDAIADEVKGIKSGVWHYRLDTKLPAQLAKIDLQPKDIDYLAISHLHPDHTGNANLFSESTFIVHEDERTYMFSEAIKPVFGSYYSELENAPTILFNDSYDVFNDGTVVMHAMPGHTPGSAVLFVKLNHSGSVVLTGDLYVHRKGYELKTIPSANTDKQATLDSRKKLHALIKKENARMIIQHDMQDFKSLPTFPLFLD